MKGNVSKAAVVETPPSQPRLLKRVQEILGAQRLRSDQEKPQLSVSIGVGIYPDDGRTAAEIIDAADQRLYRRKKSSTQRSVSAP